MKSLIILFCSIPVFSQSITAILDFDANGVSKSDSKLIVSRIENELTRLNCLQLVERNQINEILEEQGLQQSGCVTSECAVEIGQLLGTDQLIVGNVGRIGRLFTINLKIINVESGKILSSYDVNSEIGIEDLFLKKSKELAYKICDIPYSTESVPKYNPQSQNIKNPDDDPWGASQWKDQSFETVNTVKKKKPKTKKAFFIFSASNFAGSKSFYRSYSSESEWVKEFRFGYEYRNEIELNTPSGNSFALGYYGPLTSENNFIMINTFLSTKKFSEYRMNGNRNRETKDFGYSIEVGKKHYKRPNFSISVGYLYSKKRKAVNYGRYHGSLENDEQGNWEYVEFTGLLSYTPPQENMLHLYDNKKAIHSGLIAFNYHFSKFILKLEYVHDFTRDLHDGEDQLKKHTGVSTALVMPINIRNKFK